MVDNQKADRSGNILVEFDYDNIIVVDPNKTVDYQGNVSERLVDHEDLVMFANLEAYLLPRTKLAVGQSADSNIQTISIASINFLKPQEGDFLTTGYYDELTGKGSTSQSGANQTSFSYIKKDGQKLVTQNTKNVVDNGLLGITSINVRINTSFIPTITMELEDVQGRALFQLGNNSPYAAFFNLPYPPFYLTLKGYYGQAIKYQLNLVKFNARFNTFSGNYQISLEFVGYKFNILNEIALGHLFAAPHMYSKTFQISNEAQGLKNDLATKSNSTINGTQVENSNSNTTKSIEVVSEKGYQKIVEVYGEYKSKGLIPVDFPELTLAQLMNKLEQFEATVLDDYTKTDVEPLTNCRKYKETLMRYYQKIIASPNSWFNKYLNQKPFILKDGTRLYAFKGNIGIDKKLASINELIKDVKTFNDQLSENTTLGKVINNPIQINTFTATTTYFDVNILETINAQNNTGFIDENDLKYVAIKSKFEEDFKKAFEPIIKKTDVDGIPSYEINVNTFFIFDGNSNTASQGVRFNQIISQMEAEANRILADYENEITLNLASKIEDNRIGLGFKPSVRNFTAVIMANTEGFIRLLDDVHVNAWNVKDQPIRRDAILNNSSSAINPDAKENVKGINTDAEIPVYPWPQYFEETTEDKKGRFQLKYIGDSRVVNRTKGYLYNIWPEVEFVEEYLKGLTQKFNPPIAQTPQSNQGYTNILNINAIEFPQLGLAYSNKEENKFFYEIYERQFLTSKYTGLNRIKDQGRQTIIDIVCSAESENIIKSLGISNPYLTNNLKNKSEEQKNYPEFLKEISNKGTGFNYQEFIRDFFVTPYIESLTSQGLKKSFAILKASKLGDEPRNKLDLPQLLESISSDNTNIPNITDTYPFISEDWVNKHLEQNKKFSGNLIFSTKNVLTIYKPRNVISNFSNIFDYDKNRPVSNFSYLKPEDVSPLKYLTSTNSYYISRDADEHLAPTEGNYFFNTPSNKLEYKKIGSMLNTPYFLNALLQSVDKLRPGNKSPYPFITPAYLFLNSLPLISLRELYKSNNPQDKSGTNYMFATLKKFGAIHKLPLAWILKIGSIYHRYKIYTLSGKDILDPIWKDFDYIKCYDPITNNPKKQYKLKLDGVTETTIQMEDESDKQINLQYGFYPKIINDFNVLLNGFDLYTTYSDSEIQQSIDNGLCVYNFSNSNITGVKENLKDLTYKTWSIILPDKMERIISGAICKTTTENINVGLIIPSYGTTYNETKTFLTNNNVVIPNYSIYKNSSVYNGTTRIFWDVPNYGYFNTTQIKKPPYNCYINKIETTEKNIPFKLLNTEDYSTIEEIFSIFSKPVLDEFELKFLNFCKPSTNILQTETTIEYGKVPWDIDQSYENFQVLFKQLMTVGVRQPGETFEKYFDKSITQQTGNFYSIIKNFLNYDILFKFGNPSGYDRRIFDSYLSKFGRSNVTDPIIFEQYEVESLPSKNGTITLAQSKSRYPEEWDNLELEVGFSTISGLTYTDSGSYITDFFIDNNIKFTVDNIRLLSFLIKMYASQKYLNNNITPTIFTSQVRDYLNDCDEIQNLILNRTLDMARKKLPNSDELPEKTIQTVIDGQQSKVEDYEVFKSLNDKWISGSDYKTKTLFEDMLFLDRASRNIGDILYLDIFTMKDMLNSDSVKMNMSVYTFLAGLLIKNNFTIMNLPAYINFYNVQNVDGLDIAKPEGSLDFANNLWGTFLNVDYKNATPKMLCFYTGRPSAYVDMKENKTYRFNNDGLELTRASDNPLIENLQNKKDWSLSNKCVGFNVDIGIRNQNIFTSFQVSQDNGKATSESINVNLNMINQYSGRDVATQNNSLYNLYKQRSYQSTVVSMGNALLQPTMYFNLRHVPMFNGPYFITEVNHTITPGQFQTQITGTRQGVFDLPSIDSYLQSINKNLLTRLEKIVQSRKDDTPGNPTTNQQKGNQVQQGSANTPVAGESCRTSIRPSYGSTYTPTTQVPTILSAQAFLDKITERTLDKKLTAAIFAIAYVTTFKENQFYGYNNNFSNINLSDSFYGDALKGYSSNEYFCLEVETLGEKNNKPIVAFNGEDYYIQFMISKLSSRIGQIETYGIPKYYVCFWPNNRITVSTYEKEKDTKYTKIISLFKEGLNYLSKNLNFDFGNVDEFLSGSQPKKKINQGDISKIVCDPPKITSFTPLGGNSNTQVVINGENLLDVISVTVGNNQAIIKSVIKPTTIIIIPPNNSGKIKVTTSQGSAESDIDFTFSN